MIFFQNIFGPEMGDASGAERPNGSNALISGTGESGTLDTTQTIAIPYAGDVTVSGSRTKQETTETIFVNVWEVPWTWTRLG
jgi:hypothetical protein